MADFSTDFEYKDARTYVHSSTMCEFLNRGVVPALGLKEADIRLDARFHNLITNNGIMRCQGTPRESSSTQIPAAEFSLISGSRNYYIYFFEGQQPVENRTSSTYEIRELELLSPYSGSCRILINDTLSFLENTIEANKRLNQATFSQNEIEIFNLYMKRFPLNFIPQRKGWHTLEIRHIGSRDHKDGLATLNALSLPELNIPAFEMCFILTGVRV